MKWLFFTLVTLNLIVFTAFLARKIYKPEMQQPAPVVQQPAPQQAPPQVIINTGSVASPMPNTPSGTGAGILANSAPRAVQVPRPQAAVPAAPRQPAAPKQQAATMDERPQPRACSARVSIPEDDYHRIKGLLNRFPHAATRQVVEGGGAEGEQSSARMNVLFMNVNDQEAAAIQSVVGRYGKLNRTACPQ